MTPTEFDACFDRFQRSAFRLETLPAYIAPGEAERIEAFRRGEARPVRSVRTDRWLARIAVTTATGGKSWQRVRVLDDPLTFYQAYQIRGYLESQAAGDDIRIASRRGLPLAKTDFWLFDERLVMWLHYDVNGLWLGADLSDSPRDVADCLAARNAALAASVPLNEYLATHRNAMERAA
jgi:hypothetical protein